MLGANRLQHHQPPLEPRCEVLEHCWHDEREVSGERGAEKAELLLAAASYLNETLELERVYDRFHELLSEAVPHNGVIVSSFDPETELIRCDYAWVDGGKLDPAILPLLPLNHEGGMQSRVIMSGEPLLQNDVPEQVKDPAGVYYDVDREGHMRKLPDDEPPGVQSALMVPVKHEGEVVGVVQLMQRPSATTTSSSSWLEGLVGLMAAAVRNARLHEQAQAEAAARAAGRGDGCRARAGGAGARGRRRRRDDGRRRRRASLLEPRGGARHRARAR